MPTHAAVLAPLEADQHLDNPRDLVLRPRGVGECQVTVHAEDVDGCGALHHGALGHREEVAAIALRPASAAFGEGERHRCGGAFELIAEGRTGGQREGGDHRGEFEGDGVTVQTLVIK